MSDECKYYYYDSGYCCSLKREKEGDSSIDDDTVHRYCWGYNYEDCPRYKNRDSGGCFLTSACVEARGLADDCHELTVLRAFRDTYIRSLSNGEADVREYYRIAPVIVENIKSRPDAQEIFDRIYLELVLPCVEMIEAGQKSIAYSKYKSYTRELQSLYV